MIRRTDNNEKFHFQTGRLAQQNSEWFYLTREGEQKGPFRRKEDAEGALAAFITILDHVEDTEH